MGQVVLVASTGVLVFGSFAVARPMFIVQWWNYWVCLSLLLLSVLHPLSVCGCVFGLLFRGLLFLSR